MAKPTFHSNKLPKNTYGQSCVIALIRRSYKAALTSLTFPTLLLAFARKQGTRTEKHFIARLYSAKPRQALRFWSGKAHAQPVLDRQNRLSLDEIYRFNDLFA
jgi:hypothetical protein